MAREFIMDAHMIEADEHAREQVYWSGWEKWLRGHLDIEREGLIEALGGALADTRNELLDQIEPQLEKQLGKISALELKLAELTGAVDVLRGKEPPPPAKFPTVKSWESDVVFHKNDIVTFCGGTYQAIKDTARVPTTEDWRCIAAGGSEGQAGPVGKRGEQGERGPRGLQGPPGKDALAWVDVKIDRRSFAIIAVMANGSELTIPVSELFEEYDQQKGT
jgi:hypothetical protein